MADEITPHAQPIPPAGDPAWFPPFEDDAEALILHGRKPSMPRFIFYGRDGLRAGWSALLFLLVTAALQFAIFRTYVRMHLLHPPGRGVGMAASFTLIAEGTLFAILVIAAWAVSRVEQRPFYRYGLGLSPRRLGQFLIGVVWGVVILSLLVTVLWKSGLLLFTGRLLAGAAVLHWGLVWFGAFLCVGLLEEFLTRGFLQFTLARGVAGIAGSLGMGERNRQVLGFWVMALFFSVIFGLGHKNNPGESPIGVLSAGLIGLVFAFSLWRTGSLWWAVGFHAAWDWAQSFVYGVADSGTMVQNHLLASHPMGSPLMSGGLTGPEGSIYILGIILLITLIIAFTLRSEPGSPSDVHYSPNASRSA